MNAIYLRRRRKVILKEGDGNQPAEILAAMQKNLEALGFVMSPTLMDRVQTLSDERLASFYKALIKDLRLMVGDHRAFEPMYPNFPDQVQEMPDSRLYLNAIIHYITNKLPVFEKNIRSKLSEPIQLRVLDLGNREEFEQVFAQLVGSKTSLSVQDKDDVVWFVSQYGDDILRLIPAEIPSKENLAVLGAALLRHTSAAMEVLSDRIQTATDVLRLATACSGGDVSLATAAKFGKFKRAERKKMLSWMERNGNPTEDMLRWKSRWIRLGERLHPGDYASEFPKTFEAFRTLRNDEKVSTFNSRLELLLAGGKIEAALEMIQSRPGDLARRLDQLLRADSGPVAVLKAFQQCAHKVSTTVLLQMLSHFGERDHPRALRIFFPKGDVGKVQAVPNNLPALKPGVCDSVTSICENTLVARFGKLAPIGRCRLDVRLTKFMVPLAQRSASKALRTLTRGSRLPLPMASVLRFFIWWRNSSSRTDIDLSAALFDSGQRFVDVLSYYNLKNFGGCHSGDIVDAPKGAAEFIDVEIGRLLDRGVRYIVMVLASYTEQPYCDLPECFAGWMARQEASSGEVFEPRTVVDKLDVGANTRICIPAVFDLVDQEVIWADLALRKCPSFNHLHKNLSGVSLMLQSLTSLAKPNLHKLFSLHVKARGVPVGEGEPADTIFGLDEGITPYDVDRIRKDFL